MGTEAFWVPLALAAAGTGVQAVNNQNAKNRASDSEAQSIRDEQAYQSQAAAGANKLTQDIAKSTPTQIQNKATGDYVAQLRQNEANSSNKNQAGAPSSSLSPAVAANPRYAADVANSKNEVDKYGGTLADEMGGIDAAIRQRQNEGLSMADYATKLQGLNLQSLGTGFVDQLRTRQAAQTNPMTGLFGGMLSALGTNYKGGSTPKTLLNGAPPAGDFNPNLTKGNA